MDFLLLPKKDIERDLALLLKRKNLSGLRDQKKKNCLKGILCILILCPKRAVGAEEIILYLRGRRIRLFKGTNVLLYASALYKKKLVVKIMLRLFFLELPVPDVLPDF
jgi:hypothetical protein